LAIDKYQPTGLRKELEMEKYFVFSFRDDRGGGTFYALAHTAQEAEKRLRSFLHRKRPFRKYTITLEQELPA
jgi:hypothetical protein